MSIYELIQYVGMGLAFLIAIIGHEIMHGLVAKYYGDLTATNYGRLSINPLKHIDPFGSIIFPILLYLSQKFMGIENPIIFGWAKPVPVNILGIVSNGGYLAAFNVSIAGIVYNFVIAVIAATFLKFIDLSSSLINIFIYTFLIYLVVINIVLAVFNALPIPPLDGSNAIKYICLQFKCFKVVSFYNKIERYGLAILMVLMFTPLAQYIFYPAQKIIYWLVH
jgi:Zn-dependent protease